MFCIQDEKNQPNDRRYWAPFGTWLCGERTSRGLFQAEVASRAGISSAALGKIEIGEMAVTREQVKALCAVLNLDLDEALARAGFTADFNPDLMPD